ncbi:uncharacterized protein LOC115675964 isoform X1 [Syzygium oleosum]|uniref:uncharacterized protein LOC115675964 isoform X1 n=1 Tax=Syzygium oleosum TaxID=219896 RepID=UPI0024B93C54|nr:uncharacterized protein LOC115675964 isoform X1 [Syzygium oleosum]
MMDFPKCASSGGALSSSMGPLIFSNKVHEVVEIGRPVRASGHAVETDVDVDLREIYFLIMHFLSTGPCQRTFGQLRNELLEHQLLPRRYHAWASRSGIRSENEDDDGISFPLNYSNLAERYPHIGKDHLVKLLKQLMRYTGHLVQDKVGTDALSAADVPTLLGVGSFSLLDADRSKINKQLKRLPAYLHWPHMRADQVRGLGLREIGGGFGKHHRAPSIHSACYATAKPLMLVERMQNIKKLRGHRVAVYCAIFDRSGRYVITGSDDRLVKIWSMETAFCLASCRGHEGDITDLAVSSNNALVASASNDFVIQVWRLPDGFPISVLRGHTGAVTAIAFNPRPSAVYQLLSSSDDGTCRVWDARYSQCTPRIYLPKPPDAIAGKSNGPSNNELSSSIAPQSHQILCCAYNANGTVFVTGSSDTFARVWNACKSNADNPEQPVHEMDLLCGHENDVNYVQFSGCSVAPRSSMSDNLKEDNFPKFRNSWFCHDNIVTCSRDGSAIIWVPRSRKSNGKGGRWVRAYHLKVPPPPLPPQPPRGGPRQRFLPTPRGVNMIVWSLDNRFVLAAIMDCRICVWNAGDGSLVHCLTGHSASSYVLDIHPFNPRIAMSAGYDGKAIVWDIWEGRPIRVYEIGRVKLVDGKFSPDGTSIVLSDDFGQIHLINTGEGESQKDAKYDQFFLGDYRPLIRDTVGNVLDQESQLPPHRRNVQDPLCDSSLVPYPEPYQTMYQQRRLGALGIEWRPPTVRFAVGPDFMLGQEYQMLPLADLERMIEPLPEFSDAVFWEPENEIISEDNDSEYNVTEESEGERGSLSAGFSSDPECSGGDSDAKQSHRDSRRRAGRKKHRTEVEWVTSSGRRVKRRNLEECEGSASRDTQNKKSKNRRKSSKRQSTKAHNLRPQRVAARNALNMICEISDTSTEGENIDDSGDSLSESELLGLNPNKQRDDSDRNFPGLQKECGKGKEPITKPDELPEYQSNAGNRKRLVLKFSLRDSKKVVPSENTRMITHDDADLLNIPPHLSQEMTENMNATTSINVASHSVNSSNVHEDKEVPENIDGVLITSAGDNENEIKWGEVKMRSSVRLRSDFLPTDASEGIRASCDVNEKNETDLNRGEEKCGADVREPGELTRTEHRANLEGAHTFSSADFPPESQPDGNSGAVEEDPPQRPTILRFKTRGPSKLKSTGVEGSTGDESNTNIKHPPDAEHNQDPEAPEEAPFAEPLTTMEQLHLNSNAVVSDTDFDRERPQSSDTDVEDLDYCREEGFAAFRDPDNIAMDYPEVVTDAIRRARSLKMKATSTEPDIINHSSKVRGHETSGTSKFAEISSRKARDQLISKDWVSGSKMMVRSRSSRSKRGESNNNDQGFPWGGKASQNLRKKSWLTLSEHEEGYRYIPQLGDEVVYLRQGHQEFIESSCLRDVGPWRSLRGSLSAAEVCKVEALDYANSPGSGESCCKLTLKFVNPASNVFGRTFKLMLPELINFPDFLVEKTWYDNSMQRKWSLRDKCLVWWRNENGTGGSWWEGRITTVQAKSSEFPDSPWERYSVRYRTDPPENHLHSPWELHDLEVSWDHPHIDSETRDKLLSMFSKLERSVGKNQDYYGYQKLNEAAQKLDFSNRFPVGLDPELIQLRLENNYYRRAEAVRRDITELMRNAQSYFATNAELSVKMRRLSDWFTKTLSGF